MVSVVSDDNDYDYDLSKLAPQATDDLEYCALIKAVQDRKLPPVQQDMDLSSFKSVFNKLGLEDTPAGQLVVLEGNSVVVPLPSQQDILTTLHE